MSICCVFQVDTTLYMVVTGGQTLLEEQSR